MGVSISTVKPFSKIEVNRDLGKAIKEQVLLFRKEAVQEYRDVEMPPHLAPLFNTEAVMLTLHSLGHLLAKSLPFLFLSSARDVNVLGDSSPSDVREPSFIYVFDQCPDGNGGTETIYENLEQCIQKAFLFADSCDCLEVGCPKCLTTSDCPESNLGLSKLMALWMLKNSQG
jgi:DEAD/DEAH box helicase domain-containing protein